MQQQNYNEVFFSDRLRELRGHRSQAEFADFLGIKSQQTYANYEKGRIPKSKVLQQISQRLGVTVDHLLGARSTRMHSPSEEYIAQRDSTLEKARLLNQALEVERSSQIIETTEAIKGSLIAASFNDGTFAEDCIKHAHHLVDDFADWSKKLRDKTRKKL